MIKKFRIMGGPDILKCAVSLYSNRRIIFSMSIRELRSRHAGAAAGFLWAIAVPLISAMIYTFVFSVGLRVAPIGNIPFILIFYCPLIAWNLFSETLNQSVNCIVSNPHLIKKMVFPTEVLPVITILANLIVHSIGLVILLALLIVNGRGITFYMLQVSYYLFALCVFTLGLSWMIAAVNVFYRDLSVVVSVVTQMWFWFTPIVWSVDQFPEKYRLFLMLNPLSYVTEGYRSSFLFAKPFWENYEQGVYFWTVTIILLWIGSSMFEKLKAEFADVI